MNLHLRAFCVWGGRRVKSSLTWLLWINWVFRRNCSGTDETTAFWVSLILGERTTLCFINPHSCRAAFRSLHTHTVDTFCMEMRSTSRAQDIGLDGGMMGGSESVWSGNEAVWLKWVRSNSSLSTHCKHIKVDVCFRLVRNILYINVMGVSFCLFQWSGA